VFFRTCRFGWEVIKVTRAVPACFQPKGGLLRKGDCHVMEAYKWDAFGSKLDDQHRLQCEKGSPQRSLEPFQ
jgi:hypothetical protein